MESQQMNQQQTQNQQQIMPQPPHVRTVKDMAYINDMLAWNLLAMKKAHFFAGQCQDQEIKSELENCGQMHQRHYEMLLAHLQEKQQNNQIMQ